MKIKLFHRHYGVHSFIKEAEIDVLLESIYHGEDNIDESRLLEVLPEDFLPKTAATSRVLLMVADKGGSTGQRNLKIFCNWAKYFDAYSIELCE